MPKFHYIAKKSPTETIEETIEAESRESLIANLAALGYTPLKIENARAGAVKNPDHPVPAPSDLNKKIPARHMQNFIRQFSSLIRSQVPLVRALTILHEQTTYPPLKNVVGAVTDRIQQEGKSISEAMREYPVAFGPDMVSLIQSGEVGGALDEALNGLNKKMGREEEMRSKIQAALVYPLFVAVMGLVTITVLMTFVMPRILKVIQGFGQELPLPTRMLIALTQIMTTGWFWFGSAIAGVLIFAFIRYLFDKQAEEMDRLVLKLPLVGKLIHQVQLVRFCRALGLLLDHGVLLLTALNTSIQVVTNRYFQKELKIILDKVKEGQTITDGLKGLSIASPFLLHSVKIGEEGGRIGNALNEVADYYEGEVARLSQLVAGFLEPVIILAIGIVIGFIVMAVLLPIFEVSGAIR